MLSTSILALAATFLVPSVSAATSAPVCVSSDQGYATGQVNYLYNNFCQQLANSGFASDRAIYGMPVISFSFAATSSGGKCDQNNCLASYKTLVASCGLANQTIWGTGSINAGCGTYNYTVWDTTKNPITLGQATTTLVGATMTTAATIATSSSVASSMSSSSAEPTLIENSILSNSSSSSGSSSIEPADITSSSVFPTAISYTNSTSSSELGAMTSDISAVATKTPSSQNSPSATKPIVGSTALGNGGDIIRVSGLSLVAVACIFVGFF